MSKMLIFMNVTHFVTLRKNTPKSSKNADLIGKISKNRKFETKY